MKKILGLTAILAGALSLFGQNKEGVRTTVILYNVTPLKVDLAPDGTILTIHGKEDDFFKGYSLVKGGEDQDESVASTTDFYKPNVGYTVAPRSYNIDFRQDYALLSRKAITSIDEAIVYLATNPDQKIMITPYQSLPDSGSKLLLDNRLKAALMYLEVKGVPRGKIALNQDVQTTNPNQLIITFLK